MLGIVGDAGSAILIESGCACTRPGNACPMRGGVARTRIGGAVIGLFCRVTGLLKFTCTTDFYIIGCTFAASSRASPMCGGIT